MRALVIVGKAPRAGQTKTRLAPLLSADQAAELYRAFLIDTIAAACELGWERIALIHPRGDTEALRQLAPDVELLEQSGVGLENALSHAFEQQFAEGFERVVLIGSDSPTLPMQCIVAAEKALSKAADVVIGPTRDGGYYLIGMREPHCELFTDIAWSTSRVYAQTVRRARDSGLRVESVAEWYDVDEPADLDALRADLQTLPLSCAPNTRTVLGRWDEDRRSGARAVPVRDGDALANFATGARLRQQHD